MVKLKEEFDYKSLCRRMEAELDRLVAENERQAKARQENDEELDRTVEESRLLVMEAETRLQTALEVRPNGSCSIREVVDAHCSPQLECCICEFKTPPRPLGEG